MTTKKFNPVIPELKDGFTVDSTNWTYPEKLQLIDQYLQLFTGTMKRKFNYLVYLDLFAGSGLKELQDGRIINGSAAAAMAYQNQFSKYIFCSQDLQQNHALKVRVNTHCRGINTAFFHGDPNEVIGKISYYIPESNPRDKVAALCLLDMNGMEISFEAIEMLASLGVHLLVMFRMDLQANDYQRIPEVQREQLNDFIGEAWGSLEGVESQSNDDFFRNVTKQYHRKIRELGYMAKGSFHTLSKNDETEPIFVGYYSHTKGVSLEPEAAQNSSVQVSLFDR